MPRSASSDCGCQQRDGNCCLRFFTAVFGVLALSGIVNWFYFQGRIESCISVAEMMTGLPQNDSRILKYISTYHLVPPSVLPYNFNNKSSNSSQGTKVDAEGSLNYSVQKILGFKRKGFFIECSAYDGETSSKTLTLERQYDWTGLLIEPDPFVFPKLVFKHRKAWTSDVCLSPDPFPQRLDFLHRIDSENPSLKSSSFQRSSNNNSGSSDNVTMSAFEASSLISKDRWKKVQVPCFPIFSILSTLNVFHIDYLSLDVQGLELQVLKTIPWDMVRIDVISVSYQLVPEGPEELKTYLESVGFLLVSDFPRVYLFANQATFPSSKPYVSRATA